MLLPLNHSHRLFDWETMTTTTTMDSQQTASNCVCRNSEETTANRSSYYHGCGRGRGRGGSGQIRTRTNMNKKFITFYFLIGLLATGKYLFIQPLVAPLCCWYVMMINRVAHHIRSTQHNHTKQVPKGIPLQLLMDGISVRLFSSVARSIYSVCGEGRRVFRGQPEGRDDVKSVADWAKKRFKFHCCYRFSFHFHSRHSVEKDAREDGLWVDGKDDRLAASDLIR